MTRMTRLDCAVMQLNKYTHTFARGIDDSVMINVHYCGFEPGKEQR